MRHPSVEGRGWMDDEGVDGVVGDGEPADADTPRSTDAVAFGAFRLLAAQRRLERDGSPISLGAKAFDILRILVEHAGQVVGKAELLRQAWPNTIVEEASLRFHIAVLRKAMGEGRYIENIAGQGYSFVAPVTRAPGEPASEARSKAARPLPGRPRRLVGRDPVLKTLAEQLLEHRFVTVVGPGGVGKTSVALALAHDLAAQFDGDICFLDVGSIFNPERLAGGLATALGIPVQPVNAAPGIVTFLRQRRMLLILDGCEPGVEAAATLAEQLVRDAPHLHLLATSREALRAEGEHVHRLFPLDCPAPDQGRTAEEALGFAAVELFVERAASARHGFALTDEEAPFVSAICRKLDGLALAIELAAVRIDAYGVREVANQLESQFALMWPGRRTAVARHQTLSATLEWSHRLLSTREQIVFRRLSVFAGAFTLRMATAVVADEALTEAEATERLGSLVSKSLAQFDIEDANGSYRLLDMTRGYAFDRLTQANEARRIADRHAQLIRRLLEEGGGQRARNLLDDVRSAIEWCLSPEGDLDLAAALAAASAPVWLQAGPLVECRFWMTRVLDSVDAPRLDAHRRLSIQAALASAETFTDGFTAASFESWMSTFAIARSLGNIQQQLTCLTVLWAHRIRSPEYNEALSLAKQVDELTQALPDRGLRAMADWMVGITHHHLGRLATARAVLERSLAEDTLTARQAMMAQFGYDRRIPTQGVLSNLHWLEGRADQALEIGAAAVSEARNSPYPVPLCEALTWQALNLHLRGDDPAGLDAMLDEAIAHARRHFIESYVGLGLALKGLSAAVRGDSAAAALVSEGLDLLSTSNYEVFHPLFVTEFARGQTQAGVRLRDDEIDALSQLQAGKPEDWSSAEVRRNLGEILLRRGERRRGEQLLADALDCAERQGALAWALRAAISLARAAVDEVSRRRARGRLEGLLQRITQGEGTADLQAARRFLASRSN